MTRAFYPASRAHHAYCMAIDFRMLFEKGAGFWTPEGILTVTGAGAYKLFIADESLCLLEPVSGDTITWRNPLAVDSYRRWAVMDENPVHADNEFRILERDGKAFHWPEFEG